MSISAIAAAAKKVANNPNSHVGTHDIQFVVNANSKRLKCYDGGGTLKYMVEARCIGTGGADFYTLYSNTPPGLYKCGTPSHIESRELLETQSAFGPWFIPLYDMEGQFAKYGHGDGIGIHGGGSGLDDPYGADNQGWVITQGCIRLQNIDLIRVVGSVRFAQGNNGTAWTTVHWDGVK